MAFGSPFGYGGIPPYGPPAPPACPNYKVDWHPIATEVQVDPEEQRAKQHNINSLLTTSAIVIGFVTALHLILRKPMVKSSVSISSLSRREKAKDASRSLEERLNKEHNGIVPGETLLDAIRTQRGDLEKYSSSASFDHEKATHANNQLNELLYGHTGLKLSRNNPIFDFNFDSGIKNWRRKFKHSPEVQELIKAASVHKRASERLDHHQATQLNKLSSDETSKVLDKDISEKAKNKPGQKIQKAEKPENKPEQQVKKTEPLTSDAYTPTNSGSSVSSEGETKSKSKKLSKRKPEEKADKNNVSDTDPEVGGRGKRSFTQRALSSIGIGKS